MALTHSLPIADSSEGTIVLALPDAFGATVSAQRALEPPILVLLWAMDDDTILEQLVRPLLAQVRAFVEGQEKARQ